jgi:ribonucleoside-triphosphate reductase
MEAKTLVADIPEQIDLGASFDTQLGFSEILKVVKPVTDEGDTTDLSLLVTAPTEGFSMRWDRERITRALMREAEIEETRAQELAAAVERKVFDARIKTISVSLIRELVNNELFERGLESRLASQEILGMSTFNLNQLIFSKTLENSNLVANSPEAVNLAIAENTLKQYALKEIFSKDLSDAHLTGAIHLHDLGYPVRVYCSAHSVEYIKKFGLRLDNLQTSSSPAKHARTLTGHINTFLASMQAYYAGALGLGYVNIFYAPYVEGMSRQEMKQEAQFLIYSCSQNAFSRGGQTLFIDFNVHTGIPSYLKDIPAIGPKGEYTGRTYGEYQASAQDFLYAMMEVWEEGDSDGKVFPFPKMDFHVNQESFDDPAQRKILESACQMAGRNGAPYFIFDRDEVNLSMCCRLRTKVTDSYLIKHPESMRFCGFQNITLNLPQCAYRAFRKAKKLARTNGNLLNLTIAEIHQSMEMAMKAHLEKRVFIKRLMAHPAMPLWQIGKIAEDGRPYVDLESSTYIIGLLGLNEALKFLTGKQLHESEEVYKLGLKMISAMFLRAKEFEKKYNLKIALEESPAESASLRMAKVDLREYPESRGIVRGDLMKGEVYYTNSIHFAPDAPVGIIDRIVGQGKFHSLIESGAITHVFVGEKLPHADSVFNLVKKTWENTPSAQITISPEFTVCMDCNKVSAGYGR